MNNLSTVMGACKRMDKWLNVWWVNVFPVTWVLRKQCIQMKTKHVHAHGGEGWGGVRGGIVSLNETQYTIIAKANHQTAYTRIYHIYILVYVCMYGLWTSKRAESIVRMPQFHSFWAPRAALGQSDSHFKVGVCVWVGKMCRKWDNRQ